MKAESIKNGYFLIKEWWRKAIFEKIRSHFFSFISLLSLSFAVGLIIIVFNLVKNYDESQKMLYGYLVKERDFLELFAALRQAEFSAHDYFYYGNETDIEIWETGLSSIHRALNKIEAYELDEPEDIALIGKIRERMKMWETGLQKYFEESRKTTRQFSQGQKNEMDFKKNHEIAEQIWHDFLEFHYKEQYDRNVLDRELRETRQNLWAGLLLTMMGLVIALGSMLYVLKKYYNRMSENRRILETNEARYRGIVEDQTEYILRMKGDGLLLFVNQASCRFMNTKYEDQVGKRWQDFVSMDVETKRRVSKEIESISFHKPTVTVEFMMNDGRGIPHWLQFVHRGIFDSEKKLLEIQSVGRDITALKKAQQRLEAANALLESRVIERTRDLEMALAKAREIQRSKENYLAIMSHEMRTPLQSISGFSEMLFDTHLTDEQRRYVDTIATQNDMLLQLINDILDLSRLESNTVKLETVPFSLAEHVQQVISLLHPLSNAKNLKLLHVIHPATPNHVSGDPKRLRAILTNLLSNAIKFTNAGSVTLQVRPSIETSGIEVDKTTLITFEIRDTGIGIPQDRIPDLFKMYSRIESEKHQAGGTGLGLAICKRCSDLMNGKIWVESEEGKGTSFFVEIPLVNVAPPPEEKSITPPPTQTNLIPPLSILVIEDNVIASTLLRDFLFKMGIAADHCSTAKEAIHKIINRTYDMVFMDLNLPDIPGDVATSTIRSNKEIADQPIIIGLSASPLEEDKDKCLAAGMNDFLVKPVKQQELSNLIYKWSGKTSPASATADIDSLALAAYEELSRKSGKNTWQIISQTFLEETPSVLKNIQKSCIEQDVKHLRHFAHYLQGGADILGARPLSDLCKKILDSATSSITLETRTLVQELEISSEKMLRSLREKNL